MKKSISLLLIFWAASASALEAIPVKTLPPADPNLSSAGFTSSEDYLYHRVPLDNDSTTDSIIIYSTHTGGPVISSTIPRDASISEVLVLEKMGKVLIVAEKAGRYEFRSISLVDLKTGAAGPDLLQPGSEYVAVDESRNEIYVRSTNLGKFTTFNLTTGKSTQITFQRGEETIIFAGGRLLKIAFENLPQRIYSVTQLNDGKRVGSFTSKTPIFLERPSFVLQNNRFLWFLRRGSKQMKQMADLKTGTTLLENTSSLMVSGLCDSASSVIIIDPYGFGVYRFDTAQMRLVPLGFIKLAPLNYITGFHLWDDNRVRVSTEQKEVIDATLNPQANDSTGKLACDGPALSLSPKGGFALCSGQQATWWKIH